MPQIIQRKSQKSQVNNQSVNRPQFNIRIQIKIQCLSLLEIHLKEFIGNTSKDLDKKLIKKRLDSIIRRDSTKQLSNNKTTII